MVIRLDIYVGERDAFGIGFSDNVIFRQAGPCPCNPRRPPCPVSPRGRAIHALSLRPAGGRLRDARVGVRMELPGERHGVRGDVRRSSWTTSPSTVRRSRGAQSWNQRGPVPLARRPAPCRSPRGPARRGRDSGDSDHLPGGQAMTGTAGRRRRRTAAAGTLLAVVLLAACTVIHTRLSGNRYVYEDLPSGVGFPVDENILIGYVDAEDVRAMRAHAWKLWGGLTAPSRSTWSGQDAAGLRDLVLGDRSLRGPLSRPGAVATAVVRPQARGPEAVPPHAIGGRDRRRRRDVVRQAERAGRDLRLGQRLLPEVHARRLAAALRR